MLLLPHPRSLERRPGSYTLPARSVLHLDAALDRDTVMLPLAARLIAAAEDAGVELELITGAPQHPRLAKSDAAIDSCSSSTRSLVGLSYRCNCCRLRRYRRIFASGAIPKLFFNVLMAGRALTRTAG